MARRRFLMLWLLIALVVMATCGSDPSADLSNQASTGAAVDSNQSRAEVAEDHGALAPELEFTVGPVSVLAALSSLLPEADEVGEGWSRTLFPAYELPDSCKPVEPTALVGRNLALLSSEAVGQHELNYSILQFESEAEAIERVEWFGSARAQLCDRDFSPIAAEILEEGSAGAFRLDDAGLVGEEVTVRPLGEDAAGVVGIVAARSYEVTYVGASDDLELLGDTHEYQVDRWVVRYERGSPATPGLVDDGDLALDRLLADVAALAVEQPSTDADLDEVGERVRRMVPVDLVPDRYRALDQAVFLHHSGDSCQDPPTDAVGAVLEGPVWLARQARAIERLGFAAHVFVSEAEAEDYLDQLVVGGADCLASLDVWPRPTFSDQATDLRLETVDGVEILRIEATAQQRVADLGVEVEMVVRLARTGNVVATVQYLGLVGDGDHAEPFLLESLERLS